MLEKSGIWRIFMLQIVLSPLQRLKKVWIYTQIFWALWKNPNTWKKWGSFWDFFLPDNLKHIMQVDFLFLSTISGFLSHECQYVA
jgi:hypothetical protein